MGDVRKLIEAVAERLSKIDRFVQVLPAGDMHKHEHGGWVRLHDVEAILRAMEGRE